MRTAPRTTSSAGSGTRGRPPQLSQEMIVAEAMRHDIRTMSLRTLAQALGVSHSALYRWVGGTDELIALISRTVIERVLPTDSPTADTWEPWLRGIAVAMHDEFLAVPGFASRTAGPHDHRPEVMNDLREAIIAGFRAAGAAPESAQHSAYIFAVGIVGWLGALERDLEFGSPAPSYEIFLEWLLAGLPVGGHPTTSD
ncbi:TetR/AcrR family transcriptional regulator [Gordonia sp. VNQ95]|uniref:TetR/AcrR family transcriptional regulator n=1 Tax=Gordonia TaxID=2053 RepID=UPI0032B5E1ED